MKRQLLTSLLAVVALAGIVWALGVPQAQANRGDGALGTVFVESQDADLLVHTLDRHDATAGISEAPPEDGLGCIRVSDFG